jgi:tripartite-type tricarboxylate transporter receptor subunit TctC
MSHTVPSDVIPLRRRAAFALAAAAALAAPSALRAQPLARTARILIGFPPGGQTDAVARLLAEALRGRYASAVVVENRPGASGRLAVEALRAAEPDGTALLLTPSDHLVIFPHLYGDRLRYAPLADFAAVATVCLFHMGFATGPATPARTMAEFLAWARGRPSVPFGMPGPGTLPHFLGLQLAKATGLPLTAVAYRGDGPAVQDAIGGQIPFTINSLAGLVPLAGGASALRLLAVATPERLPALPGVPTIAEVGFPQLAVGGWQGVLVHARTPAALVTALDSAVAEAMMLPEVGAGIARLGLVPLHEPPALMAARLRRETAEWGPVVEASGWRPED